MTTNIAPAQGVQPRIRVDLLPPADLQGQQQIQEQYPDNWTCVKTERLALYLFATLAIAGAIAVVGLAIGSVIATPYAWLALPLMILGVGAICWARSLNDYENPKELHEMRLEAHHMTFRDLYKKHGASNLARYIAVEEGPSVAELEARFYMSETRWEEIVDTYDIQALEANEFIPPKHLTELSELKAARDQIEGQFRHAQHQIDLNHPGRTDKLHQHVNTAHLAAHGLSYGLTDDRSTQRTVGAVAGALAVVGHVGAEIAGRDQQITHDQHLAQALGAKHQKLNALQARYTLFRGRLV